MGAVHAEIEHLLKGSNIRNSGHFVFRKHFNVIVLETLCVHGAEVFDKTK